MHQSPKTTQIGHKIVLSIVKAQFSPLSPPIFNSRTKFQTNFNSPAMISIRSTFNFHHKIQPRQSTYFSPHNHLQTTQIQQQQNNYFPSSNSNSRSLTTIAITNSTKMLKFNRFRAILHRQNSLPLNADKSHQNLNFDPSTKLIIRHNSTIKMTPKSPQSAHPISNTNPSNNAILDKQLSTDSTLFSPSLSLTLSRQLPSTFDCHRATKFSPNKPNSLHFPFFSSGVPLQNHTTLLVFKRFLSG